MFKKLWIFWGKYGSDLLPVAEVEEVLQAGPQQLHHHDVELPLRAVVLHLGYPHPTLHHLHTQQIYIMPPPLVRKSNGTTAGPGYLEVD